MKILFLFFLLFSVIKSQIRITDEDAVQVRTPDEDYRSIEVITLENGLEVVLVSDPFTLYSSAAMDVGVGSFSEPEEILGLAHFLEHMLFLGNEAYPEEDGFAYFLAERGGSSNAFTTDEHTNFYFEVASESFEEALEFWSHFFIDPLLTSSATQSEALAVDSEFQRDVSDPAWREEELKKFTSDPAYPYQRFSIGTNDTLITDPLQNGLNVSQELRNFFDTYYSANTMKLAVISREATWKLRGVVEKYFSDIPNKNVDPSGEWSGTPYTTGYVKKYYEVVAIDDYNLLTITFPLPSVFPTYTYHPVDYIAFLINHQANGTLYDTLLKNDYAYSLLAAIDDQNAEYATLTIFIQLSPLGLEYVSKVIGTVLNYIDLIKSEGVAQERYEELKQMAEIQFQGMEDIYPDDSASDLSISLRRYDPEHVLDHRFYYANWSTAVENSINDFLDYLVPDNIRITLTSPIFAGLTTEIEPFFQIEFNEYDLTDDDIQDALSNATDTLYLPEDNPFIPTFVIAEDYTEFSGDPALIVNSTGLSVWYKYDDYTLSSKAAVFFLLENPIIYETPKNYAIANVFTELVNEQIETLISYANAAGMDFSLDATKLGVELEIYGYYEKQADLLDRILPALSGEELEVNENILNHILQEFDMTLTGSFYDDSTSESFIYLREFLVKPDYTADELLDTVFDITIDDINEFWTSFKQSMSITIVGYGNISPDDMYECVNRTLKYLPLESPSDKEIDLPQVLKLPTPCSYVYSVPARGEVADTAVIVHFQIGPLNYIEAVLAQLTDKIMNEYAFKVLRTDEQLGYAVGTTTHIVHSVIGFSIYVESSGKDAVYVDNRIENFLQTTWLDTVNTLTEDDFYDYKSNVAVQLSGISADLSDQGELFLTEIINENMDWKSALTMEAKLENITLEDFKIFSQHYITDVNTRRRLSIHYLGSQPVETQINFPQTPVENVNAFKAQSEYFSDPPERDPNVDPDLYVHESHLNTLYVYVVAYWWLGLIVGPLLVIIFVLIIGLYFRKVDTDNYVLL
jgi:insulysin